MHSNYGNAEAPAQRKRLVKSTLERRDVSDLVTGRGRYVDPRRVSAR